MKKFISVFLAALLTLGGGFAVGQEVFKEPLVKSEESSRDGLRLGRDAIPNIRTQYEEGRYSAFLKEMDDFYAGVKQDQRLEEFSLLREGVVINPQWDAVVQKLNEERNQQLMQAASQDDSILGQKVRTLASTSFSAEDRAAYFKLMSLHHTPLNAGQNQDENALIAIDVEYECKLMHLPSVSGIDPREGQYVLKMQQMDKMLLASESFEDQNLKNVVENVSKNADLKMAEHWDAADLKALMQGHLNVEGSSQDQVVSVLKTHQEKLQKSS